MLPLFSVPARNVPVRRPVTRPPSPLLRLDRNGLDRNGLDDPLEGDTDPLVDGVGEVDGVGLDEHEHGLVVGNQPGSGDADGLSFPAELLGRGAGPAEEMGQLPPCDARPVALREIHAHDRDGTGGPGPVESVIATYLNPARSPPSPCCRLVGVRGQASLRAASAAVSWARERMPSFWYARARLASTVLRLRKSCAAISRLVMPSAAPAATRLSVAVSCPGVV